MNMKPWCALMSLTLLLGSGQQAKSATAGSDNEGAAVSALENRFFCHTFASDPIEKRVQRLESFVFGGTTSSDSVNNRIAQIAASVPPQAQRRQSFDKANYPTVALLEQDILKKTYENDNISARLDRLEIAQFGRTTNAPDLGLRVNNLKASLWPSRLMQSVQTRTPRASFLGFASYKAPQPKQLTVVDKIEVLEANTYGKTYPGRPLQKRVESLEKSVLGTTSAPADSAITQRVAQLWQRASLAELPRT